MCSVRNRVLIDDLDLNIADGQADRRIGKVDDYQPKNESNNQGQYFITDVIDHPLLKYLFELHRFSFLS